MLNVKADAFAEEHGLNKCAVELNVLVSKKLEKKANLISTEQRLVVPCEPFNRRRVAVKRAKEYALDRQVVEVALMCEASPVVRLVNDP